MVLAVTLGLFEVGSLLWVRSGLRQSNASYTVRIYMALKVVKLMLFLGLVVGYWADVETGTKEFVSTAAGIYLIYLMWDTYCLVTLEKKNKNGVPTANSQGPAANSDPTRYRAEAYPYPLLATGY